MSRQKTIVKNIKKLCEEKSVTFSELARKAKMPLSSLQNLLYKPSRQDPRISTVSSLAKALGVSVDNLLR